MHVLIVDDSKAMRLIVARALRQSGRNVSVVEAANGAEAERCAADQGFDLILSDWNMPQTDGVQFLSSLRGRGVVTPFIFVTTEWTPEQRLVAMSAGATGLLEKPFTSEGLDEVLSKAGL